ncbi:DUF5107 domain-containing protein [Microbacterium memoriense]|uniref:DUF5107 domain-containing protein n=1 Tax=Microbacterium memoriense TaxID=2978350 RepID=A0ABT2PDB7_9MICO|nr:DUF5107 domain-containing protein [Microbacterium memoriense]MCT9002409.1 DUF5107 domain-containing protein [Microbacterium memoriense]
MTDTSSRIVLPDAPADQRAHLDAGGVACWSEPIVIDTYATAEPDRYPLFLDRRVFQGSRGTVYPMPMIDAIAHEKHPHTWQAIHLENRYVRLMLLPELGGRIHIGYDKIAGYDFFYRNNVIKPALVGLAGPWISGGVEFNWPQHHRPGTYLPVDARIEREHDGAVVVWHSDLDPLQRMRGSHGIRLRPESSLIEAEVALHNRTDTMQTFLWWANVAAGVHDDYQSFFPDDVGFVADHARRAITAFPHADRAYYGVDYPALAAEQPGADRLDLYRNIPVPTSYMVTDTAEAFFGGYDRATDAGFVHWADPALSPGKKQWTWGHGPIGRAWDAQLTDDDGPYVELMAGVYTDNQPDFAWLLPGETKRFSQFWYPLHGSGPARQATVDAAISVDADRIAVTVTRAVRIEIEVETAVGVQRSGDTAATPDRPIALTVDAEPTRVTVRSHGETMLEWNRLTTEPIEPWVAAVPPQPDEISSSDELYLTAVHLDQYRHPTRSSAPYLDAALLRDPSDSRAATARAAHLFQRGQYDEARSLLDRAVERLTARNLNPRDGEALYVRGLVAERCGDLAAADRDFARAAWSSPWAPAARLGRARIALREDRAAAALDLARAAGGIPAARRLSVLALRRSGSAAVAAAALAGLVSADPLDSATAALAGESTSADPRAVLDAAVEFARAGAFAEALEATADDRVPTGTHPVFGNVEPLRLLLRAAWTDAAGDSAGAADLRRRAASADLDLAFPAGLDQLDALSAAIVAEPGHAVARALRGTWMLDAGRHDDALADLVIAADAELRHPVVWRNLALATVHSGGDLDAADAAYVTALEISADARLVFERDVLAGVRGLDAAARLDLMAPYGAQLDARDDLALTHVQLLADVGRWDEAWAILSTRTFRPFEGGEGQVIAAYDRVACVLGRRALAQGDPQSALDLVVDGLDVPAWLGEGRHPADPLAERRVVRGDALRALGDADAARAAWRAARSDTPLAVGDRSADETDFWRGVARLRLGEDAGGDITALEVRADQLDAARGDVDYFATSLPELLVFDVDTSVRRRETAVALRGFAARLRAGGAS